MKKNLKIWKYLQCQIKDTKLDFTFSDYDITAIKLNPPNSTPIKGR